MEHARNIGFISLEYGAYCIVRVKGMCLGNIDENFLDSFTVFKYPFLSKRPRVIVHAGSYYHTGDSVNKSANKLIHSRLERSDSLSNSTDRISSVLALRNSVVIFKACVVANRIDNTNTPSVERTSKRNSRHFIFPPYSVNKSSNFAGLFSSPPGASSAGSFLEVLEPGSLMELSAPLKKASL